MQKPVNVRGGDRCESYTKTVLESIAIATLVPRPDDFQGIDFHCSLLREVNRNLQPFAPFNVQTKSVSERTVDFGGETDSGNWRRHEIEALHRFQTPFFIGSFDKDEQCLHIFQTVNRAFMWGQKFPYMVRLLLNSPEVGKEIGSGIRTPIDDLESCDEYDAVCWDIPLGAPILSIKVSEIENKEQMELAKAVLLSYIELDQENIVLTRAGLAHFRWPLISRKWVPLHAFGIMTATQHPPVGLLRALSPAVACLLNTYRSQNEKNLIKPWAGVVDQLPRGDYLGIMGRLIDESIAFANEESDSEQDAEGNQSEQE